MTTTRRSVLSRSLPVLFALFLALFSPHRAVVATAPAPSPVTVSASGAEHVARTAEASPARTAAEPVAEPTAVPTVPAARATALTGRIAADAAGSRAPPFAA
ncbi:hypothetical protein AB0G04_31545 [Actinoplanes sp. NPDC023801]|uniref:hypothetical protein n=1 Tax=Actinoplanes sp. NPDC023801 TaxID=3154595 RepID=UPI0033F9F606